MLLPPVMDFRRRPQESAAPVSETPAAPVKKERPFASAAADLLAASAAPITVPFNTSATPIFGTVSNADVVSRILHLLVENQEASRIVLSAEDVKFVNLSPQTAAEPDKIRHLGEYKVEVRVKGGETPVERLVRVIPIETESTA
jgi:ribosomal protein L9